MYRYLADVPKPMKVIGLGNFSSGREAEQAILYHHMKTGRLHYTVLYDNEQHTAYIDLLVAADLVLAKEIDFDGSATIEDLAVYIEDK